MRKTRIFVAHPFKLAQFVRTVFNGDGTTEFIFPLETNTRKQNRELFESCDLVYAVFHWQCKEEGRCLGTKVEARRAIELGILAGWYKTDGCTTLEKHEWNLALPWSWEKDLPTYDEYLEG